MFNILKNLKFIHERRTISNGSNERNNGNSYEHANMHKLQPDNLTRPGGDQIPVPQLRRNNNLALQPLS
jgi:hypothetical protein